MALTRAEISRRYRERHPDRYLASVQLANEKRRRQIQRQKEVERLSRALEDEGRNDSDTNDDY